MRYIVFILLLLPALAFGQYPEGPSNKIKLGVQTTANGLAFTSNTGPTINPANDTSAYLWLDTLAGRLWYWDNGAWDTLARYWIKTGNDIYYDVGNVGIGTNNPTSTLDISGLVGTISFNTELASSYNFLTFNNSADSNSANISYYGANDDLIITGGGLYIGNSYSPSVNIGEEDVFIEESLYLNQTATNDSDSILVVQGNGLVGYRTDLTAAGDNYWTQTGSDIYYNLGNVGIGTTTPGHPLHVFGDTADNYIYIEVDGEQNDVDNPFITLYANQGSDNRLFEARTANSRELFLGVDAGANMSLSNESGGLGRNVGIGLQSLRGGTASPANNDGYENLAVGYAVMRNITTGDRNVGIGSGSFEKLTTGNENLGIGYQTLYNLTSGSQNVSIGTQSQLNRTTGNGNLAFGYESMYGVSSSTTGSNNVGIGLRAGYSITSGSNNLFMGRYAGGNISTGSGNIILGDYVSATSATGTGLLSIGNVIYGENLYNGGSPSSTPTASGKIGILDDTPDYTLDIGGTLGIATVNSSTSDSVLVVAGNDLVGYKDVSDIKNQVNTTALYVPYWTGSLWASTSLNVDGLQKTYIDVTDYNSAPDSLLVINSREIERTSITDVYNEINATLTLLDADTSLSGYYTANPNVRQLTIVSSLSASASSDNTITLPTPSASYLNFVINIVPYDNSGDSDETEIVTTASANDIFQPVITFGSSVSVVLSQQYVCIYEPSTAGYYWARSSF